MSVGYYKLTKISLISVVGFGAENCNIFTTGLVSCIFGNISKVDSDRQNWREGVKHIHILVRQGNYEKSTFTQIISAMEHSIL